MPRVALVDGGGLVRVRRELRIRGRPEEEGEQGGRGTRIQVEFDVMISAGSFPKNM